MQYMGNDLSFRDICMNVYESYMNTKKYIKDKYNYFRGNYEIIFVTISFKLPILRKKYNSNIHYPRPPESKIQKEVEKKEEDNSDENKPIEKIRNTTIKRNKSTTEIIKKEVIEKVIENPKYTNTRSSSIIYTKKGNEYVIGGNTYDVKSLIKLIKGWKYDPKEKLWSVPYTETNKKMLDIIRDKQLR